MIFKVLTWPICQLLALFPARWFSVAPEWSAAMEGSPVIDADWSNYHPCMGCGTPLSSSRQKYCDDQCRREYKAREAPTEIIDPALMDIPF